MASESAPQTRILVIDDDRETGDLIAELLTTRGYAVDVEADAQRGLQCFESRQHDVVVSDLSLDDASGLDVAAELCRARRRPLLIAITGHVGPDVRRRSLAAGFDHHLPKPIEWNELVMLIAKNC